MTSYLGSYVGQILVIQGAYTNTQTVPYSPLPQIPLFLICCSIILYYITELIVYNSWQKLWNSRYTNHKYET